MIETPKKDVFRYPVATIRDMSLSEYLGMRLRAYRKRTNRPDGLDIIRDTLATYGVVRFSQLPLNDQLAVVRLIEAELDKAT
jgi:hypothetical protein